MLQFQLSKENSSFPLREWKVVPYKILKTVFHFSQRPSRSNKVCLQSRPIQMRIYHSNERCRISAILRLFTHKKEGRKGWQQ